MGRSHFLDYLLKDATGYLNCRCMKNQADEAVINKGIKVTDKHRNMLIDKMVFYHNGINTPDAELKNISISHCTMKTETDKRAEGVNELICFVVDMDVKKEMNSDWVKAIDLVNNFRLPPTFKVLSGNGLHIYWCLQQPIKATTETIMEWEDIQLCLAYWLQGDKGLESVTHLLRLPETRNIKNLQNILECKIASFKDVRYVFNDFDFVRLPYDHPFRSKKSIKTDIKPPTDAELQFILDNLENVVDIGGGEVSATCPFHEDRNPSLGLNLTNGMWLCRASHCGAKGNARSFKRQYEELCNNIVTNWRKL